MAEKKVHPAEIAEKKSTQYGEEIRTVEDMMRRPQDDHTKVVVTEMMEKISGQRTEMEEYAVSALDDQHYEGGDKVFNAITVQLETVERLLKDFEVWSTSRPVGSPAVSNSQPRGSPALSAGSRGGRGISETHAPSPPPFAPMEHDDMRRISDGSGSARKKKNKKDKKFDSGDDVADWGASAPDQGSNAWGDTAGWGTIAPAAPTGAFGDLDFGDEWGTALEKHQSESRNGGFPSPAGTHGGATSGWASEASSHHFKDRHGGSTQAAPVEAMLQIRRPYAEIERDVDGFKSRFRNSIAHAIGIPAHRIRIKQVQGS